MSLYFTLDPLSMLCLQKPKQRGVSCLKAGKINISFCSAHSLTFIEGYLSSMSSWTAASFCTMSLTGSGMAAEDELSGSTEARYKKQIILKYESCKATLEYSHILFQQ